MVLGDDDKPFETAVFASLDNLVRIKIGSIQEYWIFVAVAPFAVGIGVKSPMDDADDIFIGRKSCGHRWTRHRTILCQSTTGQKRTK